MSQQKNPKLIIICQGSLMLGIALAPALTSYRFQFPQNILDWIGTALLIIATTLVALSIHALKQKFTYEAAVKSETKLVKNFPFNFSRNPMYLGGLGMCFSWSLLQRSYLAAAFSVTLVYVLNKKISIEEKNLELVFKDEYLQYKAQVRRFF